MKGTSNGEPDSRYKWRQKLVAAIFVISSIFLLADIVYVTSIHTSDLSRFLLANHLANQELAINPIIHQCQQEARDKVPRNIKAQVHSNVSTRQELTRLFSQACSNPGQYRKANRVLWQAWRIYKGPNGLNDPRIAGLANDLNQIYSNQDMDDYSQQLLRLAVGIYESNRHDNEPTIVKGLHAMAERYHNQGKFNEADSLDRLALSVSKE